MTWSWRNFSHVGRRLSADPLRGSSRVAFRLGGREAALFRSPYVTDLRAQAALTCVPIWPFANFSFGAAAVSGSMASTSCRKALPGSGGANT